MSSQKAIFVTNPFFVYKKANNCTSVILLLVGVCVFYSSLDVYNHSVGAMLKFLNKNVLFILRMFR